MFTTLLPLLVTSTEGTCAAALGLAVFLRVRLSIITSSLFSSHVEDMKYFLDLCWEVGMHSVQTL